MFKKKEELKELDPLNIELNDNLTELDELFGSQSDMSEINDNADNLKVEYLIRINNNLGYIIRAFLGIEKSLARIAEPLEIISAGK